MKSVVVLCVSVLVLAHAQMVPQCLCSAVVPCVRQAPMYLKGCGDRCQSYITHLGASYPAIRQCIEMYEPQLRATMQCAERNFQNTCAASPGPLVPKRYEETFKLAAFREVSAILNRSGVMGQVGGLVRTANRAANCFTRCMKKSGNGCLGRMTSGCSLALPSDSAIVATIKSCAISSGLHTTTIRNACDCFVRGGMRQLAGVCNRIVIS